MLRTTWSYDRNNILLAENLGEFYKKATTILFILFLSYDHKKNVYTLTFASSSTTSNALSCFPTTDGEDSVEYNWPSLTAGRRKRQKFTWWTTLTMDAAILNIHWLAKDWGEDLGKFFRVGKEEAGVVGGGGGFDSVVLRRGLEDSTPFNQSTVPDKEINSKRKINERFITRRFGVLMTTLSSRDVNNIHRANARGEKK